MELFTIIPITDIIIVYLIMVPHFPTIQNTRFDMNAYVITMWIRTQSTLSVRCFSFTKQPLLLSMFGEPKSHVNPVLAIACIACIVQ